MEEDNEKITALSSTSIPNFGNHYDGELSMIMYEQREDRNAMSFSVQKNTIATD